MDLWLLIHTVVGRIVVVKSEDFVWDLLRKS